MADASFVMFGTASGTGLGIYVLVDRAPKARCSKRRAHSRPAGGRRAGPATKEEVRGVRPGEARWQAGRKAATFMEEVRYL